MPANLELDPLIGRYEHDSNRPQADHAILMIRKVASIVKPIMRRRGWRVGLLAEFFPDQNNLLGLNTNHGQMIELRLRYAHNQNSFLPMEEVTDTMLHELCHNEIGPHNSAFHALWEQLRDEHEALVRNGYTGEGFLGRGERLGGQRIPMHEARRRARAAAEQRRTLTAKSGQRLGGGGIMRGQDARAVIADAIERRLRIERGCGSGTDTGRMVVRDQEVRKGNVTVTQVEQEDYNEAAIMQAYIDLIEEEERAMNGSNYIPPSAENPAGPRSHLPDRAQTLLNQQKDMERNLQTQKSKPSPQPPSAQISRPDRSRSPPRLPPRIPPRPEANLASETWTCEICTLVNPASYLTCDACAVERPSYYPFYHPQTTDSTSTTVKRSGSPLTALKPRLKAADAHDRFERESAAKVAAKPVGWQCCRCGNWMEQEWWTCSVCGCMKSSS